MKLYSPAWIIVAGVVLVQTSGVLSTAGSALIGIDNAIKAVIDLKAIAAKIVPPQKLKFVPIKPVIVPPRHAKQALPTKVSRR